GVEGVDRRLHAGLALGQRPLKSGRLGELLDELGARRRALLVESRRVLLEQVVLLLVEVRLVGRGARDAEPEEGGCADQSRNTRSVGCGAVQLLSRGDRLSSLARVDDLL